MRCYTRFTGGVLLLAALSLCLPATTLAQNSQKNATSIDSLSSARAKFKTEIIDTSFQGDGEPQTPPADIFSLVHYPAKDGPMAAFLTPNPNDGKKHPAVIWLVGGYGGIGDDDFFWAEHPKDNDQSGSAFRHAGLVMMVPSFRGENNNPGRYEMFYGEIDDIASARTYLASLPYVDPNRIYLAGHSTGGTRVLLASEALSGFRAAFSLGGIPDLKARIEGGRMMVAVPFNQKNPEEFRLRSPGMFVTSITSPTFYFEGEESYWPEFNRLKNQAKDNNIPFHVYEIEGADHFNIISPVTEMIAQKIVKDTGEKVNISFSADDINRIKREISR
ncbi:MULTISPECIES: S9 family peptidase [unclassified Symbiopectobacterium]|uniref:alpha/beta hydrolase family protein n=1 Tax=unclassified Symbiopectobacterium TaxID=2794573 RepID=UPI002225F568|nr:MULTISPECIES: prolyl oligopeptidase family serine peptidase [unclassified Symbiopectobacterium]MCW2473242.1 prolyl oligopeptidase family serine peptidase [Candidatus Symbiopectobacterium sp. NZEC151]MCW2482502.1 prolyl oligopeptidase family serine peptidase [Candidatus Symbiopectobacterium sp. NZEC135]